MISQKYFRFLASAAEGRLGHKACGMVKPDAGMTCQDGLLMTLPISRLKLPMPLRIHGLPSWQRFMYGMICIQKCSLKAAGLFTTCVKA